jgi:isopentenyl-diphosphate delta-isomerase
MSISQRKDEQIAGALRPDVIGGQPTGLDRWKLRHRGLPGLDLAGVDLRTDLFGRTIRQPLLISSMTGGSASTARVNRRLAAAAEHHGIAMALGSLRAAVERPVLATTYDVRSIAPSVPLLANIGIEPVDVPRLTAVCRNLEVDGLIVHLNPLQEAIQPEGRPSFTGAVDQIRRLVEQTGLPVMAKEVGFGFAPADVELLIDAGVAAIDVAGAGGTNWALVEGTRDERARRVAAAFADWGWPTADAITGADVVRRHRKADVTIVGSGGITSGVGAAVALCLGADVAGLARRLLPAAVESTDAVLDELGVIVSQLTIAAFATGAATMADLDRSRLVDPTPQLASLSSGYGAQRRKLRRARA